MDQFRPAPRKRRIASEHIRRLIGTAWLIASLALPAVAVIAAAGVSSVADYDEQLEHTVRAGETLTAIALRYGVTIEEIMQANGLADPNRIYAGQVLSIPRPDSATGGTAYVVRAGDSLSLIARRYGVTTQALLQANPLPDPNRLSVGQRLIIPAAPAAAAPAVDPGTTYTLQRGDSLYRVSLIFGVPVDDLLAANELAGPNAIYPGLTIRVPTGGVGTQVTGSPPGAQTGGRTYTIQRGDTLASIAIRYNVTVDGLAAANGLTAPDRIYPGQVLNIPEAGAAARPAAAIASTMHTVRAGDTLAAIALRYGVTVHSLAVANGLSDPSRIYAGMVLSIPTAHAGSNSVRYASVGPGLCQGIEPTRAGTGYFVLPVRGYVISQSFHPWHPGIDLAGPTGTSIRAADGGTVVYAGWNSAGYGNLIVLDHGSGWRTYYAHLKAVEVSCGDWVPRGAIIGQLGSTGNSTGPHLHFEILRYGVAVNPAGYLRF